MELHRREPDNRKIERAQRKGCKSCHWRAGRKCLLGRKIRKKQGWLLCAYWKLNRLDRDFFEHVSVPSILPRSQKNVRGKKPARANLRSFQRPPEPRED